MQKKAIYTTRHRRAEHWQGSGPRAAGKAPCSVQRAAQKMAKKKKGPVPPDEAARRAKQREAQAAARKRQAEGAPTKKKQSSRRREEKGSRNGVKAEPSPRKGNDPEGRG